MNHAAHVWPHTVNQQVHADLARNIPASRQLAPLEIDNDQVRRPHHALAHGCGSNQYSSGVEPNRKIPIHPSYKTAPVQHAAETYNFVSVFAFARHLLSRLGGTAAG
jgi:hypothetical protein